VPARATLHHALPRKPEQGLIVLTCMDARIEPMSALGLRLGDAHIIRNAGAAPTEDVLRSIAVSREVMGTREIVVLAHTNCAAHEGDDAGSRRACREHADQLAAQTGMPARALFYDVHTGAVVEA
jgi:carbonic anhydrase